MPVVRSRHQVVKRAPRSSRTTPDGEVFASIGEMRRYYELLKLQEVGIIRELRRQVRYALVIKDVPILTEKGQISHYTPDFVYEEKNVGSHGMSPNWIVIYEEYKGFDDPLSQFRRRVFAAQYGPVRITGPAAKAKPKKKKPEKLDV